jgi:hypothetical protein
MPVTLNAIQKPRTPGELMAYVEQIWEEARVNKNERDTGNLRTGLYKQFFDEIVPLAKFAIHAYQVDDTITPFIGSQGFDAEVRDTKGKLIERVEIASPIDGKAVAELGQRLASQGRIGFRIVDPVVELKKEFSAIFPTILGSAHKKSRKDYTDCSLVFNIALTPAITQFEGRQEELISCIKAQLASINFKAKRVFVLLPSGDVDQVNT